jgi:hypothetical protein
MKRNILIFSLILFFIIIFLTISLRSKEKYETKIKVLVLCAYKQDEYQREIQTQLLNQLLMEDYDRDDIEYITLNLLPDLEENGIEEKADFYIDKNGDLYNSDYEMIIDDNYLSNFFDFIILESCPWISFDPEIENLTIFQLKNILHFNKLKKGGFYLIFSKRIFGDDPTLTPFENYEKRSKGAKEYFEKFYNIFNNYLDNETTQIINGVLILKNINAF